MTKHPLKPGLVRNPHLRAFGCVAYSHVPKDQRKKLDSKAKKCIFLAYAEQRKGYRLYDMGTSKIIHSRDVVFNESSRGIDPEQEENQIVQVESFPEEMEEDSNPPEEDSNQEPPQDDSTEADSTEEVETETQIPQRTSSREIKRPDYYGVRLYTVLKEPETVADALRSSDKTKWEVAMQKEMDSIHSNDVWDLVKLPKDCKPVGNKWVFKRKTGADGNIERYKARLVAQGKDMVWITTKHLVRSFDLNLFVAWLLFLFRKVSSCIN